MGNAFAAFIAVRSFNMKLVGCASLVHNSPYTVSYSIYRKCRDLTWLVRQSWVTIRDLVGGNGSLK